jgi:inositol oxygenase
MRTVQPHISETSKYRLRTLSKASLTFSNIWLCIIFVPVYKPENKDVNEFRKYKEAQPHDTTQGQGPQDDQKADAVAEFYKKNHLYQTYAWAKGMKEKYGKLNQRKMTIWEAIELLNTLVDESGKHHSSTVSNPPPCTSIETLPDPDTNLSQLQHLLQTAEAIRQDNQPRWFILAGMSV